MALFKTNHYRIERNRVKQEENNGLTVTGVRVLLNTWCSKATEEQILSRIRDIMGDENEAPEKKICQRIEKLFEEEITSVKVHFSYDQEKVNFEAMCPFSIHITMDEENGMTKVETKPGKSFNTERTMEVLEISVSRF